MMEAAVQTHQRVLTQRSLMVPYRENGEVDWKTLGNILTANMIEEVLYGSYIDLKHRDSRPDFTVDTDWRFSYEESGVVVLRKSTQDSPFHCWMGRAVIDFPLGEIASFIADPNSAPLFDKFVTEARAVDCMSESDTQKDVLVYYKTEAKQCLVKAVRDLLFYVRHAHFDGKYVQTAMSVEHPLCPPVPGIIRAQVNPGSGWHLEPYQGSSKRTLVTYLAHMEMMEIPPIIANRVLKRQPLNILHVGKHMALRQRKKQRPELPLHHNPPPPPPPPPPHGDEPETVSGDKDRYYEDALSVSDFTKDPWKTRRAFSDPTATDSFS